MHSQFPVHPWDKTKGFLLEYFCWTSLTMRRILYPENSKTGFKQPRHLSAATGQTKGEQIDAVHEPHVKEESKLEVSLMLGVCVFNY